MIALCGGGLLSVLVCLFLYLLCTLSVYKDSGKRRPSGQRVVIAKGTPVSAVKEVASFLSWVLGYEEVDLAFRDPLLHCPEATNIKFKGI